jgi:tetratricopeptide (TPR) repeat protein
LRVDRTADAIADFTTAIGLDARSSAALVGRALAHLAAGAPERALEDLQRATDLGNSPPDAAAVRAASLVALTEAAAAATDGGRHDALLEAAALEGGWRPPLEERVALGGVLTESEVLVALARCARHPDVMRRTTLLVTSGRLIWSRRPAFGPSEVGWLAFAAVDEVRAEPRGFAVVSEAQGMTIRFTNVSAGVALLGAGERLDGADDVRELVAALVRMGDS